ncbi:hypothetical protein [Aequorivita echinoideorum]|uniref:Uncharacterized protein n=1 Tax=Aequorivita echinoideorum TaxID=1549647 RepID=A0ABS5S384_9FLAO|nr:hypothetical protein [Aequorivita echinoideorum]MBT0607629.1 hypothetical protein [Aequorivita echinoideorum]
MPQDYSITHNIPVADHVYKYLKTRCGTDHIKASRATFMGSVILSLLGRNQDVRPQKNDFRKIFKVDISESYYEKNGMHITPATAQLFNAQIDKMFREELYAHMIIVKSLDKKLFLKSMRTLLDVYQIDEEDIKMDTLYRDFKRKKDQLENNLNLTSTSGTI